MASGSDDIEGVRRRHGYDAADRGTTVQCRRRTVQHFYVLYETGINEIAGRIRETSNIEMI